MTVSECSITAQSLASQQIDITLKRFLSCDFSSLFGASLLEGASGQSSQFLRVYL
jgi:hypothetical protein